MNDRVTILDEADELPPTALADINQSLAVGLTRAEIDQQIATARAYPRSLKQVAGRILSMATLDYESAEDCLYALPRGDKPIKGPSIRFAEILKQSYGNCRAAARVVHVDRNEKFIEAEGVFHDLETNSATSARVRRRIVDKRGRLFSDDMIIVTGNAACSIALRNAILGGVPKPLWRRAYDAVQSTIAGDVTTLSENRTKAVKALAMYGVKPEQIFAALGVAGEEDVTVDHIVVLRGMYSALKNGEATVEEMFAGREAAKSQHERVANPLADTGPAPKPKGTDGPQRDEAAAVAKPTGSGAAAADKPAAPRADRRPAEDREQAKRPAQENTKPEREHQRAAAGRERQDDAAGAAPTEEGRHAAGVKDAEGDREQRPADDDDREEDEEAAAGPKPSTDDAAEAAGRQPAADLPPLLLFVEALEGARNEAEGVALLRDWGPRLQADGHDALAAARGALGKHVEDVKKQRGGTAGRG